MTGNVTLAIVAGVLIASGVYLLTERSLTRILVGVLVMSNGVNILFLVASGSSGNPPLIGLFAPEGMADPLPMAMVLTAIVIMLATVSFVLAMAYRSWQLTGHDDVQDDVEDALIRRMARQDVESDSFRADSDDDEVELASDFTEAELAEAAEAEARRQRSEREGGA